jgi:hypothetical protein
MRGSSDDGHWACNGFTSSTSRRRDFGQWACSAHLRLVFLLIKLAPRSASPQATRVCTEINLASVEGATSKHSKRHDLGHLPFSENYGDNIERDRE